VAFHVIDVVKLNQFSSGNLMRILDRNAAGEPI
jgi:hypothetical protein